MTDQQGTTWQAAPESWRAVGAEAREGYQRSTRSSDEEADILWMAFRGTTQTAIAASVGVSQTRVGQILRDTRARLRRHHGRVERGESGTPLPDDLREYVLRVL